MSHSTSAPTIPYPAMHDPDDPHVFREDVKRILDLSWDATVQTIYDEIRRLKALDK